MIYIFIIAILFMGYVHRVVSHKIKRISDELCNIKKEFYFVCTELNVTKDKCNYLEFTLNEVEQDTIENYKHLDEKMRIYNNSITKNLNKYQTKLDLMG